MERKVCFISDSGNVRGRMVDICPPDSPLPSPQARGERHLVGQGLHEETADHLTVIFKLVISGLTSIILNVSGTVNLQFQGPFFPISLRSILGIVATQVLGTVCSSCS